MHIDEAKKFDKRNIQRNIKEGIVSQKDLDTYLSRLPDVKDKILVIEGESKETESKGAVEGPPQKGSTKKKTKGK